MAASLQEQICGLITRYRKTAFLVDFDGTLVDLVPNPSEVCVPGDLILGLDAIERANICAFAIVTGRALSQMDAFLNGIEMTSIGSHGAEYRAHRGAEIQRLTSPIPPTLCDAIRAIGDRHSCFFEDKTYSLSLHLPFTHAYDAMAVDLLEALGDEKKNYFIRRVGRTYEVLKRGVTKGTGILHLMQNPRFLGRQPVYIGDDAHIDESLHVVTDMGGLLFPARHIHHHVAQTEEVLLETGDVRTMVAKLRGLGALQEKEERISS